jgi:hypothetical protein
VDVELAPALAQRAIGLPYREAHFDQVSQFTALNARLPMILPAFVVASFVVRH